MHVLHIITSLSDGGAEAILYRMCKFDKEYKHTVISLMGKQKYGPMLTNIGVDVHVLDFPKGKIRLLGLYELYKFIKQIKPDVVQTWLDHADLIGGVIARLAGIKNIVWGVHHAALVEESKLSTTCISKINAFLSNFIPKKIIYCAEESRIAQEKIGYKKTKGEVIRNGYDIGGFIQNKYLGEDFRNELGISINSFLIGHVGRYDPHKDLSNLIEAFALLNRDNFDLELSFIGTSVAKNHKTQ
jgi:glycosyltransferase involved in cell wall biosynthesis